MKLLRSAAIVSAMTFLSRMLGFVRDMVIAVVFGAGAQTDAFLAAFKIPNYFRRLFAEGSFALAFVPVLSSVKAKGDKQAVRELIDYVSFVLIGALLLVTALGVWGAQWLVRIFAPGFMDQPETFQLAVDMTRITFPYLMLVSLTGLAGGILNTYQRFALPAVTPVLLNLSLISAAWLLSQHLTIPVHALAWGVFAGGVLQLLAVIPGLIRLGLVPRPRWGQHEGVRRILRMMLPTLVGSSVAQINLLVDTLVASFLVTGSMTWLYFSDRMLEFPLGVFGVALSTVVLPTLSRHHADADQAAYRASLEWAVESGLLIALPATVGLFMLAEPLMLSLFQYGQYSAMDASMAALSLKVAVWALPAYILVKVVAPAFYAREDSRTPVRIAIRAMLSNMVLNIVFVFLLALWLWPGEAWPQSLQQLWQWIRSTPGLHPALALAGLVSGWMNFILLKRALSRQLQIPLHWRQARYGKILLATLVMAVVLGVVLTVLGDISHWQQWGMGQRLGRLFLVISLGAGVYGLSLWLMAYRWSRMA